MPPRRRKRSSPAEIPEGEASTKRSRGAGNRSRGNAAAPGEDRRAVVVTVPRALLDDPGCLPRDATVVRLGDLCAASSASSFGPSSPSSRSSSRDVDVERSGAGTLRDLVAPMDERLFLATCFRRSAVHSQAACAGPAGERRLRVLTRELFDLDPEPILASTASENVFVWLRAPASGPATTPASAASSPASPATPPVVVDHGRRQRRGHDLIQSIEVGDPATALALHGAGHATYCRAPPSVERWLVSNLLASTGLGCGQYDPSGESSTCLGRGEVEVFLGTPGHFTNWHWDFQENFTVQLSGVKRWTLRRGPVPHPLRGCTPHYRSPEAVEPQLKAARLVDPDFEFGHPAGGDDDHEQGHEQVVTMHPGDVLYFPAGMWHRVEVIEPGASLNVSLMASNYAAVTCQALQHLLLQRTEWRECVANNSHVDAVAHLRGLLRELPSIIEDFERKGGADAILPPAVRDCSAAAARLGRRERDQPEGSEDEDEDDGYDDDAEDVVDVTRERSRPLPYQCTEAQLRDRFRTHRVVRNPLAVMIREHDILRFYKTGDDDESGGEGPEVFVLNVNYAGNESHEAHVRARILGTGALLPHVFRSAALSGQEEILPDVESWIRSEAERSMLGCLVYYGFLVWIPREPIRT